MSLMGKLEDRFGRLAIPQLTLAVIICQVAVYGLTYVPLRSGDEGAWMAIERLQLVPAQVLEGEVWRLVTFLAIPPFGGLLLCDIFGWYLFYLMGTALEYNWGTFRYNVFLLVGYLATVAVAFLRPEMPTSALFWQGSVFLAFAHLYPYFVLHIFFILPVQIRWLALLTWILYGLGFLFGGWEQRLVIGAAVSNFLLFFGKDVFERVRTGRRHMAGQVARYREQEKVPAYYHRCLVCGITDRSHPRAEFRYCSKCAGDCCYCMEHLRSHEHVTGEAQPG
jgi:hypothetical protein